MKKEKVYCSECKHGYILMNGPACRKTKEAFIPETFYRREHTESHSINPAEQNQENNCEYYEART